MSSIHYAVPPKQTQACAWAPGCSWGSPQGLRGSTDFNFHLSTFIPDRCLPRSSPVLRVSPWELLKPHIPDGNSTSSGPLFVVLHFLKLPSSSSSLIERFLSEGPGSINAEKMIT